MKLALLLVLVVWFAAFHEADAGWFRIRLRRAWRFVKPFVKAAAIAYLGKRDISELDKNMDGHLDQSELEKIMTTREANDLLEMTDHDGDSMITTDQFEELVKNLT